MNSSFEFSMFYKTKVNITSDTFIIAAHLKSPY